MTELQFIGRILVIAIAGALPPLLILLGVKEAIRHPNQNIVKLPKVFLWISLGGLTIFWGPSLYLFISGQHFFPALMCFLFGWLGVFLLIAYINRRTYLHDDYFIFKSYFGKKTKYFYSDVDRVLHNELGITVMVGKKKLAFENLYVTSDLLAQKIPQEKHDYTNNRTVQMGGNYIFISIMLFVAFTVAVIIMPHPAMITVWVVTLIFMIACRTFKIVYDKDTFTRRNIWGVKKTFDFADITKVSAGSEITVLKVKNRYLFIESHAIGLKPFIKKAEVACRRNRKQD